MKPPIRALLLTTILGMTCIVVPVFAQAKKSPVQITAFPSGVGRYEPGQWASMGIQASNLTDADANPMISVYFGENSQTQFARKVWLPPKSTRKTWLPVRLPKTVDARKDTIAMTMMPLLESP